MLTAANALALLHAELGSPLIQVLDTITDAPSLRNAVAEAARHPKGGLLALLAPNAGAITQARTTLAAHPQLDLQVLQVSEGVLLLAHVTSAGRRAAPARPAPTPWSTPDTTPVPGSSAQDLDDDILRRLLRQTEDRYPAPHGTNEERYLARRGLLALDAKQWRPTVAAMLIAGRRPDLFLPVCAIVVSIDGETRTVRGTVPELLRSVGQGEVADVDASLLTEVVRNALLHRSWSVEAPVRIELVGERLIVVSPGGLRSGAPQHVARPNPLLVHFACALCIAPGAGRGLRDVAAKLERMRRPAFSLIERQGEVWFVADVHRPTLQRARSAPIRKPPESLPSPTVEEARPAQSSILATPTPTPTSPPESREDEKAPTAVPALLRRDPDDRAEAVLATLRARGHATTREVAELLGCSRPVVGKVLTALVAEGKVRPTVAAGRSPFQSYELVG